MTAEQNLAALALEIVQDMLDDWRHGGLPREPMADALAAHAAHLRSGAETPLVATTGYLDDMPGAKAAHHAHAAELAREA